MNNIKDITPGKWDYDIDSNNGYNVFLKDSIKTIALVLHKDVSYMPTQSEAEANAQLIAEAGTVANECGKSPRQLLEERNELLKVLDLLVDDATDIVREYVMQDQKPEIYDFMCKHLQKAKEAINKVTQ